MIPANPQKLCQIEIPISDVTRAVDFYEKVFGWRQAPTEIHEYIVLEVPETCPFGISLIPQSPISDAIVSKKISGPVIYFEYQAVEDLITRTIKWGGRKRFGPKILPGIGAIYQIEDPDGNRFGFVERRDYHKPSVSDS